MLFKFLQNGKKLKTIQKDLLDQKNKIESYLSDLPVEDQRNIEWCTVHNQQCMSTGLLMWEKDLDFRYVFMNTRHCNDFFFTSFINVKNLIGKTDGEIIAMRLKSSNNSFGQICNLTDIYTIKAEHSCRFWEMGYIDDKIMILDVTKTPIFKNGKIIGVRSWALNQSVKECEVKALIELFLKTGQAVRLDRINDVNKAAYLIYKKINPFNGIFPR